MSSNTLQNMDYSLARFSRYIEGYIRIKELLLSGYSREKIREITGLNDETVEKYNEIVEQSHQTLQKIP